MDKANDSFPFRLGSFECLAIRDTTMPFELDRLFPDIPVIQVKQLISRYKIQIVDKMEVLCLLIKTGKHIVLIDTGWGTGSQPHTGRLVQKLQDIGIQRQEIDTLILSHGHPDHIGGVTDAKGRPNFPAARHVMHKKEWEFWTSGPELEGVEEGLKQITFAAIQKNLIHAQDLFDLVENETEIIPGIKLIEAPGHTPGNSALTISSSAEQLLCICDVAHHPSQITKPGWFTFCDLAPEQARDSRIQIIRRAASTNALVFLSHFPFPGLGHIRQKDDVWLWHPINT